MLKNVLVNDGRNGFARTAPFCESVEEHELFLGKSLLELLLAIAGKVSASIDWVGDRTSLSIAGTKVSAGAER